MSSLSTRGRTGRACRGHLPRIERLEDRSVPAVTAVFNSGVLTVLGDRAANNIVVSADANGALQVTNNGQAVTIRSLVGQATRENLNLLFIDAGAGNDVVTTDGSLNTLVDGSLARSPDAVLLGGAGHDVLTVKHGGIVGGLAGVTNGVVTGQVVGNCVMDGGDGNDTLTSGFGNDVMRGGRGDDTYLWPPGTLTDVWDGGEGNDTVRIVGNDSFLGAPAGDAFSLTANGERVRFQRTNLVQFTVDIGSTENIELMPGAGDDTVTIGDLRGVKHLRQVTVQGGEGNDGIDASAQLNACVALVANGGKGNDTLLGGLGRSVLFGDDGDDFIDAGRGRKEAVVVGGAGADTFVKRARAQLLDFYPELGDTLVDPLATPA